MSGKERNRIDPEKKKRRNITHYFFVLIAALFLSGAFSLVNAQTHTNLRNNLESQPIWGPTGYDYVENYYLPNIQAYYNISRHRFYYNRKGRSIRCSSLPSRYHNFDLFNSYKVVLNVKEPWRHHGMYREKYDAYRDLSDQQLIRDSRDPKYFVDKKHPDHNIWVQQQNRDTDSSNGWNRRDYVNGSNGGNKK